MSNKVTLYRKAKLKEINHIVDTQCKQCPKRDEAITSCPAEVKLSTHLCKFCHTSCEFGQQIRSIGEELVTLIQRPADHESRKKKRIEEDEWEEAVQA